MSIQSMAWALEQQLVTDAGARHVLLCLCNYAGESGLGAFPSSQTLAANTGMSRRNVQRKLDDLEAAGLIRRGNQALAAVYIARSDRRPVVYDVVMRPAERDDTVSPRAERGDKCDVYGVTNAPPRDDTVSPNPSITIIDPKSSKAGAASASRGCRLPEDWEPSTDLATWAIETLGCATRYALENDNFHDYWRGVPGAKGVKLDWPATFRKWIRTAHARHPGATRAKTEPRRSVVDGAAERIARQLAHAENLAGHAGAGVDPRAGRVGPQMDLEPGGYPAQR